MVDTGKHYDIVDPIHGLVRMRGAHSVVDKLYSDTSLDKIYKRKENKDRKVFRRSRSGHGV